jgi:hypothetical protein
MRDTLTQLSSGDLPYYILQRDSHAAAGRLLGHLARIKFALFE